MRSPFVAVAIVVAMTLLAVVPHAFAGAPNGFPQQPGVTAPGNRDCGNWPLFGHRFPIETRGIDCAEGRRLLSMRCALRPHRRWSCASARPGGPFVSWFPTADLFRGRRYPEVLLRRYPCSQSRVTPRLFGFLGRGYPTRRQLLADDVLRCGLVRIGDSVADVEATLGRPDGAEREAGRSYFAYDLGLERSPILAVDSELLRVDLRKGHVTSIAIVSS